MFSRAGKMNFLSEQDVLERARWISWAGKMTFTKFQCCELDLRSVVFVTLLQVWLTNSQDDMTKKLNLVLIAAFPLNTTMKKVNLLKLFIFPFVLQQEHVEICFLTSRNYAENISVICSMFMSKKHSFSSLFSGCNVYFGLEINFDWS